MSRVLTKLISGYQRTLSQWLPSSCRYTPSCSEYSKEAIVRYGAARGTWMGMRRIARCTPWGSSGYDPVPDRE